jgi:hypothetical protein
MPNVRKHSAAPPLPGNPKAIVAPTTIRPSPPTARKSDLEERFSVLMVMRAHCCPTVRVSDGGPMALDLKHRRSPAVHCTRLVGPSSCLS